MNLPKAIEIVETETRYYPQKGTDNRVDAIKLLIEAGKREESRRKDPNFVHLGFLPGETEE